jgi:hypothetical protein
MNYHINKKTNRKTASSENAVSVTMPGSPSEDEIEKVIKE